MRAAHRLFLGGQSVSLLGDGLALLAVPLLVLQLTHDPFAAGLSAAPRGVGYLLVGLPAGPIVDRLNPWAVLIGADLVRAAVFMALAILAWLGTATLWAVLGLAFVAGAATVFFDAALAVALKDLFRGEGLLRANSVLETAAQTSRLTGPALIAVLAATIGISASLLINAATFVVSLLSLLAVYRGAAAGSPRRLPARGGTVWGLGGDFMDGLRHLGRVRPLLAITVLYTLINLFLAVDTLVVFFAQVTLGLPLPLVSAVVAAGGAGGVAGALVAPWLAARIRPLSLIALGVAVAAGSLLVMSASTTWWPLLVANGVQIWAVVAVSVVSRTLRQAWTPRELQGRVVTTSRVLVLTATPIGAAVAGVTTRAFGDDPRPVFAAAGVLIAATIAVAWLTALRAYADYDGETDPPDRARRGVSDAAEAGS
ncbi:MAG: MFS transporter [Actinomadura sp.]